MRCTNDNLRFTQRLPFKFSVIFSFLMAVIILVVSITTYFSSVHTYKRQCLQNAENIGNYLERQIQDSGELFISYQKYFLDHHDEINISFDFNEYETAHRKVQYLMAKSEKDRFNEFSSIKFDKLSEQEQKEIFIYLHEYWLLTFENARKSFDLPYTYYIVPDETSHTTIYIIDGQRMKKDSEGNKTDDGQFLYLGNEYVDLDEEYEVQWTTWKTGEKQNKFQIWNNEWGHTYAFYTPLIINGQKLGLIGTEIEVDDINDAIFRITVKQALIVAVILLIGFAALLYVINARYIIKIGRLEADLRKYTETKNPEIAKSIESYTKGHNELTSLSRHFSSMIIELDSYMKDLQQTSLQLKESKKREDEMKTIANRDALTGLRNKNSYDTEIQILQMNLEKGHSDFGIAMIDLNFLKQTNDTYGHECGNIAIKKLCKLICNIFEHSPVFRIGGDEFVIILENNDFRNSEILTKQFNLQLENFAQDKSLQPWEHVSAAIGVAVFDPSTDKTVSDVFNRADQAMYQRKLEMKANRT